ncbi:hypothetical protein MTO96_004843 [Rhipicephalus appendiculatus]
MISLANKYLSRINYNVIRHVSLPANVSLLHRERLRSARRRFCTGNFSQCEVRYEWKDPKSEDEVVNVTYLTAMASRWKALAKLL